MSKSLYSGVNKVYFRSYLLLNIVASSAYIVSDKINLVKKVKNLDIVQEGSAETLV